MNEEVPAGGNKFREELKFDLDVLHSAAQTALNAAVSVVTPFVVELVLNHLIEQMFKGRLTGMIDQVTGNSPFQAEDLLEWFDKFGLLWTLDLPRKGYVIIGREDFDKELLQEALEVSYSTEYDFVAEFYSQEDFLNFWLFGVETNYYPGDPRIADHPGLSYLASLGDYPWPWPATEAKPGSGYLNEYDMLEKHPLLERFGYTVSAKAGLSQRERRKKLDTALTTERDPLSLREVVNHIAYLIKRSKRRHDDKMAQAIAKWEQDLDYLRQKYYKKQFRWPSM
ncbi:MAG: hypothetical protein L0322_20940 [Chloroflexi bacterium]|nr:hypothetical protein [Chloroflexota bacterium]MCI0575081.1 hypothetical protein [Chloroflexota bacterium]